MGLLSDLQDETLRQRKAAMKGEGGENATFLAMILSNAASTAKRTQREVTDKDAEAALRTELRQQLTLLNGDPTAEVPIPPLPESDYRTQVTQRVEAMNSLLPQQLEGQLLFDAIREVADAAGVEPSMKTMGLIMKALDASYPGRVSGAVVKDALTSGKV